jgi:3-dehydroquinate synthase
MTTIHVKAEIDYPVHIGTRWQDAIVESSAQHEKIVIVTPRFIAERYSLAERFADNSAIRLYLTPEGEAAKDISVVEAIWEELGKFELDRKDAIVAFGGGTTTDLGGFVAATWLRGVAWYAIPSTLAGMVDAAVGGKTGINTAAGKNLVGAFHSPKAVFIDLDLLETLSDRDFSAGLAEVIKTGYIQDTHILTLLKSASTIEGARAIAKELVERSVAVKASVVSQDFTESGLREILNYGHTLGHAIEKHAQYRMRHGECVSIGLVFASLLAEQKLGLDPTHTQNLIVMLNSFNLPTSLAAKDYPWESLVSLMMNDKKSRAGQLRFIGIQEPGKPDWIVAPELALLAGIYEKILV